MKKIHIKAIRSLTLLALFWVVSISSFAQAPNVRERVFIDVNTHELLVGETLQYSTFCLSNTTNQLSALSKFLYVELIGENGIVFQRKHELINGKANGEFFIPSSIETGQYYLVAYTRWMRNFDDVAQSPLVFINPYKGHTNADTVDTAVEVEFSTLSGELIAGATNHVDFKIHEGDKPLSRKGRIVGDEGKITDISSDSNGLGNFEITPTKGGRYQLVIENEEGGFEFFDLPASTENGVGLNISHTNDMIELRPIGTVQAGQLQIEHHGEIIYERTIKNNDPIKIKRTDLPQDVLRISFTDAKGINRFVAPLFNTHLQQSALAEVLEARSPSVIEQELSKGNYSISIRKSFSLQAPTLHSIYYSDNFNLTGNLGYAELQHAAGFFPLESKSLPDSISFLPEYRYQLLGAVLHAEHDSVSVSSQNVTLSLTGENTLNLAFAKTDKHGQFLLEYKTLNRGKETPAHLTVPAFENEYSFEIIDNFKEQHHLNFSPVIIDTAQLKDIRQRSIISQLENAYFTTAIDSSEIENTILPTISSFTNHFEFDDYVRFRTLKEHFVEYIPNAGVREKRGRKRFVVYSLDGLVFDSEPLVMLDGVPVNAEDLLEFSPYRIKSVDISNKRYFLGPLKVDGLLSFQTIQGNLGGFTAMSNHYSFDLLSPRPFSETSKLESNQLKDLRIPDPKIQLLWLPDYKVNKEGVQQIQFNTSDVEGGFELVIEGFTDDGLPVSIIKKFTVTEHQNEKG